MKRLLARPGWPSGRSATALFVGLTLLGLAGNYFRYPVFFSIDFLFGSIFSMLALQLLGGRAGVLSALVAASFTYVLWNHPYAIVILTLEAVVVAWLHLRRRMDLVLADASYWLMVGMPLVFVFYYDVMQLPLNSVVITLLKQAINGITNVLIARALYMGVGYAWGKIQISVRELIFCSLFGFVLLPSLLLLAHQSQSERDQIDLELRQSLLLTAGRTKADLDNWLQGHIDQMAFIATLAGTRSPTSMQVTMEHLKALDPDLLQVGLIDEKGISVAYTPLLDEQGASTLGRDYSERPFLAELRAGRPAFLTGVVVGKVARKPVALVVAPVQVDGRYRGNTSAVLNLKTLGELLARDNKTTGFEALNFSLLDKNGHVIVSSKPDLKVMDLFAREKGELVPMADGLTQWSPEAKRNISISQKWRDVVYISDNRIGNNSDWRLILEAPVAPFQLKLYAEYSAILARLGLILMVALMLGRWLSRIMTASFDKVGASTRDLPERLARQEPIQWGESKIVESQQLLDNFRQMASSLSGQFDAVNQLNAELKEDIAERKKIEMTLRENERLLSDSQEAAGIGSYINDFATGTYEGSEVLDDLFGITKDYPHTNQGWVDLMHPDYSQGMNDALLKSINEAKPFDHEYKIIRPSDGLERWMHGLGRVGYDAAGKAVSLIGTVQDITERKQADSELRASEQKLMTILESLDAHIYAKDQRGCYIYANQSTVKFFGRPLKDILGRSDAELLPPEIGRPLREFDLTVIESGHKMSREETLTNSAGQTTYHWSTKLPLDFQGDPHALIGFSFDITQQKQAQQLVEQYRSVVQASPDSFWITDGKGSILETNGAAVSSHGYSSEELLRLNISDIDAVDNPEKIAARVRQIMATGRASFESRHRCKNGSVIDVDVTVLHLPALGDRLYAFIRDITERKRSQEQLRLAAKVFSQAREGIMITDARANIVEVNDSFSTIFGYSSEEVLGRNPSMFRSGRQSALFYASLWQSLLGTGRWNGEIWDRRKSGEEFSAMLSISAVRAANGLVQNYVSVYTDLSNIKEHERQLQYMSQFDVLTGLPNRVLLIDRLQKTMRQCRHSGKSLAVAYLDLDNFKTLNDRHGQSDGDKMLLKLAENLKLALREGDTLARIGGDEFVALIVDLDEAQDCYPVIECLLQAASDRVTVNQNVLQVSASLGLTFYPQDGVDADQLLRHASQAMFMAKQQGKNRHHLFDVAHDVAMQTRHDSIEEVRKALGNKEFVLYWQPKVNIASGQVVGAEALIRWRHPAHGLLSPYTFLPLIEGLPISMELGEWVIDEALTQMAAWRCNGLYLPVSVNLEAAELQHADFPLRLQTLLGAHPEVPAQSLELEVLEGTAIDDLEQVSGIMKACQAMGVHFALDDFGTGYSSLTYLKHLPAETLKIDQSFVRNMLNNPSDLAIVKGVIALGKAFGRQVIAEGVETIEHGNLLLSVGCTLAQGYAIARPMPAADVPGWIANWQSGGSWAAWRKV